MDRIRAELELSCASCSSMFNPLLLCLTQQPALGRLKDTFCLRLCHSFEILKELIQRVTRFDVIEQVLYGNASPGKAGSRRMGSSLNGIRLVRKPAPLLHLQHSRKTRPPVRMVSAEITYQQEAMDGCFDIPRAGSTGSAGAFFL